MKTILSILGISLLGIYRLFLYFTEKDPYREDFIKRLRASRPSFSAYYQTYLQKGLEKLEEWLGAPFSTKALYINTFFAILYAISFFAVSWIRGSSGKIGTISILSESLSTIERISIVLLSVLAIYVVYKHRKIDSKIEKLLFPKISSKLAPLVYRLTVIVLIVSVALVSKSYNPLIPLLLSLYSPVVAGAGVVTIALVIMGVGTDIGIGEGTGVLVVFFVVSITFSFVASITGLLAGFGAIAVAGLVAFAVTVTVALAVTVASTGAVAVGFEVLVALVATTAVTFTFMKKAKRKLFSALYTYNVFLISLLMVGLSLKCKFVAINSDLAVFLFFIIILPFINGFMDFVSLGISRILSKKIYEDIKHETYRAFVLHLAIDLAAAVLLLVFLVFAVCFGTQLFNIFVAKEPELAIDLPGLIKSAKQAPFGPDGFWITLMLLSTLVPTFAHFVIALAGTFAVFFTPKLREKLADLLEEKRNALPALYYTGKFLFGLLFAVVFWGIVVYGINYLANFANMLSKIAYWSIDIANKIPH